MTLTNVEAFATDAGGTHVATVDVIDSPVHLVCPMPPKRVCLDPGPGNTATVRIEFGQPLHDVELLCLVFHFNGDLVEPGEEVLITFEQSASSASGFGNVGSDPIAERELCITDPVVLAGFVDGHETGYVFSSRSYVARPGQGCEDRNHVHVGIGDCVAV